MIEVYIIGSFYVANSENGKEFCNKWCFLLYATFSTKRQLQAVQRFANVGQP